MKEIKKENFLGTGWSFPPSFARQGKHIELSSGNEDVEQSIRILLSTLPGERVMREDFGCDLSRYSFSSVNMGTITGIQESLSRSLNMYEKRIRVSSIYIDVDSENPERLSINLEYFLLETNTIHSMIFPFYLQGTNQIE